MNARSFTVVMSFDGFSNGQSSFTVTDDPDTRDSGIVTTDQEMNDEENLIVLPSPGRCRPTVSSPSKVIFDLDEGIEDLVINEYTKGSDDREAFAASLRQLGEFGFAKETKSAFKDITNKMALDESPKTHLPTRALKRTRLYDFNFSVRCSSKVYSQMESNAARKVDQEITPVVRKKKKECRNDYDKENVTGKNQRPDLRLFMRAQSTSVVEMGSCSRNQRNHLPQFLHVDYSLETVSKPQIESVAFKSVSGDVLARLMTSLGDEEFSKRFVVVDCRYPYEYEGGHLKGAINIFELWQVHPVFFPDSPSEFQSVSTKIPIFYCEYSQKRGPRMAYALRGEDRKRNEARYPEVDYKEIYLLDRGYKKFFEEDRYEHLCEPQSYTRMIASSHKEELKRYQMHKSKSTTNIGASTVCLRRDQGPLVRLCQSVDESPKDSIASEEAMFCESPTAGRKAVRRNMFGSPFTPPKCETPVRTSNEPIPFKGSYS